MVSLSRMSPNDVEVCPYNSAGKESVWRWGRDLLGRNLSSDINSANVVAKQKRDGGWNIYEKCRKTTSKAKSLWDETEMRTEDGTRLMRAIFGEDVFEHPKPLSLLQRCCQLGSRQGSTVLDFFAGSGTTGHAVMNLNAKDGGKRKFILVTPLSRFLRDNLSRIFTKPLKTLDEKYFRPVPNALRTFFWRSPNHPKTPFFTLFDRHRRSSATAPPRAPVRSRDRDVPVVRLRTRAGPSVCRRQSASSAVR